MKYILLKREKDKSYYIAKKAHDSSADILGDFLAEVGDRAADYKKWLNDPQLAGFGNNLIDADKEDGKIIMQMEWESEETAPSFVVTIEQLNSILSQWEKLHAQLPNEIVVYKEGEDFILKGRD